MVLSSYSGISDQTAGAIRRMPSTSGVRGKALLEGRLVVMEHVQSDPEVRRETVAEGVEAAMAVPLFESEEIVGALVVATRRKGRTYSLEERERLMTFAQHASLALTDARTVESMRNVEQEKDLFVSMLVHELKSPISVIKSVLHLIIRDRHEELDDELARLVQIASERTDDLHRLVNRMLMAARLEFTTHVADAYLPDVVGRAVAGIDAGLIQVADVPSMKVRLDKDAVHEVLQVLIENALTHAEKGTPVRLEVTAMEDGLNFSVVNRGSLPADVDDLFRPFKRGVDGGSGHGVGLGLYIAWRLAKVMNGRLSASSKEGWVTFSLTVPIHPA